MAAGNNRARILEASISLFNNRGVSSVSTNFICEHIGISPGNLYFHFRNKEAIVQAVWEQLVQKQRDLLAEFRILPLFEDIERLLASTFELQQQYQFFYIDTLEIMRAYPEIVAAHQQHIAWQVLQMEAAIRFNQSRGAFIPAQWEGQENQLANQFWMIADLWRYRQSVLMSATEDYAVFRSVLWALFRPIFTDMGLREFEQLDAVGHAQKILAQ